MSFPILFQSGWNWNFKFGFLGQYGQNTNFQTKWTKNTADLKIYLAWFSSKVQFALTFFAQNILKKHWKVFICYFYKFSVQVHLHVHYCTFEQLVGQTLIEIESAVPKQTRKCAILLLSKHSASDNFLPPSKGCL